MKKSIVAGLIILALIILISPGIVGHLAEKSVDTQLEWAADENQEVVIKAATFDRGWFSSAGQHRIEFADTVAGRTLRSQLGFTDGAASPALIIDTVLDHGLIPVSSMGREDGSLMPGLGSAESRLSIEMADGSIVALPGIVHTRVGLTGAVSSNYVVEAGSAGAASWGKGGISVKSNASQQNLVFDADFDSLHVRDGETDVSVSGLRATGDMTQTKYGFSVGTFDLSIADMLNRSAGIDARFDTFVVSADSKLQGERLDSRFSLDMAASGLPEVESVGFLIEGKLDGVQAESMGRVLKGLKEARAAQDPLLMLSAVEGELQTLLANGFDFALETFDVTLPEGKVSTVLDVTIKETDPATFTWASLLLGSEARADIRIPKSVLDQLAASDPNLQTAVGMGFLQLNGDAYEMAAEYRKGLLTVNGAPMPIPLPAM